MVRGAACRCCQLVGHCDPPRDHTCWLLASKDGGELAAAYCGESTVDAFIKRVGREYPLPRVCDGRRRLWLKDDLDAAILPAELVRVTDVAEDL